MTRSSPASSRCRSSPALIRCTGDGSSCQACTGVRPSSPLCARSLLYQSAHAANRAASRSIRIGDAAASPDARAGAAARSSRGPYSFPAASRGPPVNPGSPHSSVESMVRCSLSILPLRCGVYPGSRVTVTHKTASASPTAPAANSRPRRVVLRWRYDGGAMGVRVALRLHPPARQSARGLADAS